jgi:hypothetical protein
VGCATEEGAVSQRARQMMTLDDAAPRPPGPTTRFFAAILELNDA